MATISVHDIQEIAVKCVSDFLNQKVPLSAGLSKQASERNLNTEQLKRAVEATNTLAYLKSLEVAPSRTGEFPLADFGEIIKMAFVPDFVPVDESPDDFFSQMFSMQGPVEKTASLDLSLVGKDALTEAAQELQGAAPEDSQMLQMIKYASVNAQELDRATAESFVVAKSLTKAASDLCLDAQILEKLSAVSADQEEFSKLAGLVLGEPGFKEVRRDWTEGLFSDGQLVKAAQFSELFKKAGDLMEEIQYRSGLSKQAEEMTKEALLAPTLGRMAGMAGRMIKGIPGAIKGTPAFVKNLPNSVPKAVGAAAGGVGSATGKAIKAPFVVAGRAAKNVAGGLGRAAGAKAQNMFANTGVGQKLGVPNKAVNPAVKRRLGAAVVVGGAALDATMFTPKVDPANDHSGGVWDALNR